MTMEAVIPATKTPDGGGEARAVEVSAKDFAFSLAKLDVQPGETIEVTLANADSTEHSFTIDDGVADIEAEGCEDAIGAFTAPDKSVEFYCKYHPGKMRGTVNVSGDSSSSSGGGGAGY